MKNKGFSLVELIVVVAIMAILLGLMAPFLIKYVEKTNVSSDIQLCDSIRSAIITAKCDPDVFNATDGSASPIEYLEDGNIYSITYFTTDTEFTDAVTDIIGVDIVGNGSADLSITRNLMKSHIAKSSGELKIQVHDGQVYVWIDHSDITGAKNDNSCTDYSNLASSNVIYAN